MHPNAESISSPSTLSALAQSFDFMNYDVALLSDTEAEVLAKADITADRNRESNSVSVTEIVTPENKRIAFYRFPSLPEGKDIPSDQAMNRIARELKPLLASYDLVIALSHWGWVAEREYLAQNPDIVPDMLFGSGLGSGVNRVEADGRCVWVRPYDKGRTVSEIQLFTWPDRSKRFIWNEPEYIKTLTIGLGDQYDDHPDVSALFN